MKEVLSLGFGLDRELMTTVRLTTGGVCSLVGLNIDETEDCKVCVSESLLLLLHGGYRNAKILFSEDEGLRVTITGEGGGACNACGTQEDEISSVLISALAADVDFVRENGRLGTIGFRFKSNGR